MRNGIGMRLTSGAAALAALLALAGCERGEYYMAPGPPPPPAALYGYEAPSPISEAAQNNGYQDGIREGQKDRWHGHGFRPTHSDRYEDAPGYSPSLGGSHREYRRFYREGFYRGYEEGYEAR
jgi:hypothetical protein